MPDFVIQSGKHRGKKLRLTAPRIVIGRDQSCQIRLTAQDVSRYHCLLRQTETGWIVRDLGSSNGTWVNEEAVTQDRELAVGDRLRVGPMILELVSLAATPARPSGKRAATHKSPREMTEDEIVNWLVEETSASPTGDTTIIASPPSSPATPPAEPADTGQKVPPESGSDVGRVFKSVAEEAADIIRRHWEQVKQEESNSTV